MTPNIRVLRWVAIIVPAMLLAVLDLLRHTAFEAQLHTLPGFLTTYGVIAAGAAIFSFTVFGVIERLQDQVVERNQQAAALNAQLERQNEELSALLSIGRVATSSFAEDDLLNQLLDTVIAVAPSDAAEIWLTEQNGDLHLRNARGPDASAFMEVTRFRRGEGLPGQAVETRQPVIVEDLASEPRFLRQGVVAAGYQSYRAFPLLHRGRSVGVLAIASLAPGKVSSPEEIRLLEAIGDWLALAIENARLHHAEQDAAVLEERERIAREMHDGMAQVLGYINTQTLAVKRLVTVGSLEDARAELTQMEDITRDLYTDIREGIVGLRGTSDEHSGLDEALREFAGQYTSLCGIPVEINTSGPALAPVDSRCELQLIRIVQEALTNVRKHARATGVAIHIVERGQHLEICIADDGQGFDIQQLPATGQPRFGLQTMRERAEAVGGTLTIESSPGAGTRIGVRVPTNRLEFL